MKTEVKTKTIKYIAFIADDGKEFDNAKDCRFHDKLIHGKIKKCEHCNGKGEISEEYLDENYHTGAPEWCIKYHKCKYCKGKGYLEKKTVWE